ncbi:Hypothetical protein D9617_4g002950 [Elsinoe fawcettii]|nr:Hypothetical protein D9617_4g002950 [Elsinoe fawcettii]
MARCLEASIRAPVSSNESESVNFLQLLVLDVQRGKLPPSPSANSIFLGLHLLLDLPDQAMSFWSWLARQGSEYLDQTVYARAVQLAVAQRRSMAEIEAIYEDYLRRFPGTYLEYHLSSNAVLGDADTIIAAEVPAQLLRSLIKAQLVHGQTSKAYLTLDTLLRLLPETARMGYFEDLIRDRPLSEAFILIHTASQYAQSSRNDLLNDVLDKMRPIGQYETHLSLIMARATIRLLYVFLAASHSPSSQNFSRAILNILRLTQLPAFAALVSDVKRQVADLLFVTIKQLLALCDHYGIQQTTSAMNHMLTAFGKNASHEIAVEYILQLKTDHNIAIHKSGSTATILLQTAGNIHDRAMLRQAWAELCQQRDDSLTLGDWTLFAEAAMKCEYLRLFNAEAERLGMADRKSEILVHATARMDKAATVAAYGDAQSSASIMEATKVIHDDVACLGAILLRPDKSPPPSLDVPPYLAMSKGQGRTSAVSMQQFYTDLMSADGRAGVTKAEPDTKKENNKSLDPAQSRAAIQEQRYRNWLLISELLVTADRYDSQSRAQQKLARARGEQRSKDIIWTGMIKDELRNQKSFGLSDLWPVEKQRKEPIKSLVEGTPMVDVESVRRVRRLHGK